MAHHTLIFSLVVVEESLQVIIDGVTYVSHEEPARRSEGHHVAMVNLAPFDLVGMLEQILLRESEEVDGYEVCCIPFYTYGLALGDLVGMNDSDVIDRVISRSGRRVLRVLFAEPRPAMDSSSALREAADSAGLLCEWNGDGMVAIDVPDIAVMQPVFDSVHGEIQIGTAFCEWSDSRDFRAA